jgi:asparagine synthetase B (glutamine-hydrolysing)
MSYLITRKNSSPEPSEDYRKITQGDFHIYHSEETEAKQEEERTYLLHGLIPDSTESIENFRETYKDEDSSLKNLDGFYTGIIIEKNQVKVFRDVFGTKTAYYCENTFALSSGIKPLLQILPSQQKLNRKVAADYLANGMVDHRRETFFQKVKRLKPKENLHYNGEKIVIEEEEHTPKDKNVDLKPLLEENIEKLKPENGDYYCPVSGGLDSTITTSKCEDARHIHLLFLHGTKDKEYLPDVKSEYDLNIQEVEVKPIDLLEEVENTVYSQEEPTAFPAVPAQSILYKNIQDGNTVISGTGADELFYGYSWFLPFYLADKLKEGKILSFFKELAGYRKSIGSNHLHGLKDILLKGGATLPSGADDFVNFETQPMRIKGLEEARRKHLEEFYFPHMLRSIQKNSQQHDVDVRPVFLSRKLFELSSSVETDKHFQKGLKKFFLRSSFSEELPESVYHRKQKTGFVSASNRLYTSATSEKFLEVFESDSFQSRELIESQSILKSVEKGCLPFETAYRFYNFELWMREFID